MQYQRHRADPDELAPWPATLPRPTEVTARLLPCSPVVGDAARRPSTTPFLEGSPYPATSRSSLGWSSIADVAYGATNTQDGEPIFQLVQAMLAVSGDRCRRTVRA